MPSFRSLLSSVCQAFKGNSSIDKFALPSRVSLGTSAALLLCSALAAAQNPTAVDVTNWRYDLTQAGQNTKETLLTPQNVHPASFGKLFSFPVDGYVYAQPLYVSGLRMADGLTHNVLYIATAHDSLYALDADANGGDGAKPLWQASFLNPAYGAAAGATTVPNSDVGSEDIHPEIGVISTPAIDLATKTIFVVSKTKEGSNYIQRLHAISLITGAEQPRSPVVITGSVAGTGNGSSGGQLNFSPLWELNRVALSFFNGHVYMAFGAHGDNGPWHGWVFSYDSTTLAQTGAICLSANGFGNGIWESGGGLPIDASVGQGRLFLVAGNGSYSNYPPISQTTSFGDSIVQLDLSNGGVKAVDAFTPFNQAHLTASDLDQGAGGILLLPTQQGSHPNILLQAGKEGRILLINRDNMGGYAPGGDSNPNALQEIQGAIKGLWSTPAYWNDKVYTWGNGDYPKQFDVNSGVLTPRASSTGTTKSAFPGASPVISSNGTQNGIMWAVRTDQYTTNGASILYAFDATDLNTELYESDTNAARDQAGQATKFAVPVVTNGKVYVATAYEVDVYGLLDEVTPTATPVINPNGGSFTKAQSVSIADSTPNAVIYYTLDGSEPTSASAIYKGPLQVSADTNLKAVASAQGYLQSALASATFTFASQTAPVSFTPAAGTYSTAQKVTLSDSAPNSVIHYTVDGSKPTTASATYQGPITVNASSTINAIAVSNGLSPSEVSSAAYVIAAGGTTINYGNGFASVAGLTLNGSAINSDDSRLQLTSGATYQAGSVFYNQPIGIQSFVSDFNFQISDALADGFTFTIQNTGVKALGQYGGSLGYGSPTGTGGIGKSVAIKFDFFNNAGEGTDSTGIYLNGAYPTQPSVDLTASGIQLSQGNTIAAHVAYDGKTLTLQLTDIVTQKTVTESFLVNIPQVVGGTSAYVGFTGGTGLYSSSQKILTWTYTAMAPPTSTPVINYGSGFAQTSGLTFNGSSTHTNGLLALTSGDYQAGSSFYNVPVGIQSFTSDFSFQLSNALADGFTFTIQNASPTALGQSGSNLGYSSSTGGIPKSVALKFDIYNNAGEGNDSIGLYTNGASPTVPAFSLTPSGVILSSGNVIQVHLAYSGATLAVTITDTVTKKVYSQSFPINISQVVGGNTAYAGFTAGTGGKSAIQKILTWTLSQSTN